MPYDDALAERISEYLDPSKGVVEKRLFGCACFLLGGNVVVGVWGDSLVACVGPDAYDDALHETHVRAFDITGRPMGVGCGSGCKASRTTASYTAGSGGR
jgi:hypothetical protein